MFTEHVLKEESDITVSKYVRGTVMVFAREIDRMAARIRKIVCDRPLECFSTQII